MYWNDCPAIQNFAMWWQSPTSTYCIKTTNVRAFSSQVLVLSLCQQCWFSMHQNHVLKWLLCRSKTLPCGDHHQPLLYRFKCKSILISDVGTKPGPSLLVLYTSKSYLKWLLCCSKTLPCCDRHQPLLYQDDKIQMLEHSRLRCWC